jgi:cytochrome P450
MNFLARFFGRRTLAETLDLAAPRIARDPYPHYEALRRTGAVHYLARHDAWIVLSHDDVQNAFAQPQLFANAPYADIDDVLLAAGPPEHAQVRAAVMHLFSADAIERLAAFAEERANALLKPRMDLVAEYANALSEDVAAQLLGISDDDLTRIRSVIGVFPARTDFHALIRIVDELAIRTAAYTHFIDAGFDARQARSLVRLLWLAATATTERVIAHSVLRLLQHPEARDVARVGVFVQEVLRLHPPELLVPRQTTQRAQLGGATIPANALVFLCIAAANRDPAKFEHAAELRFDRPPTRIFTFGFGIHHCIGTTLGRRVVEIAVRTLLERAPRFRAAQPLDDVIGWCTRTSNPVARLLMEGIP